MENIIDNSSDELYTLSKETSYELYDVSNQ